MSFQDAPGEIRWKVHFNSPVESVYEALTTDEGRAKYWAESAEETDGIITFKILNYAPYSGKILRREHNQAFGLEYYGTEVHFNLEKTDNGGTILSLNAIVKDEVLKNEMTAGWVSVLMAMKAAVDFGVDLRNHDIERCWDNGYLDN